LKTAETVAGPEELKNGRRPPSAGIAVSVDIEERD
jgi:hypothetical protein